MNWQVKNMLIKLIKTKRYHSIQNVFFVCLFGRALSVANNLQMQRLYFVYAPH